MVDIACKTDIELLSMDIEQKQLLEDNELFPVDSLRNDNQKQKFYTGTP